MGSATDQSIMHQLSNRLIHFVTATSVIRLVATGVVLLLCSCAVPSKSSDNAIVAAAKQEARKRWGNACMEVESVRFVDGHYTVFIWRLPFTPGGFATVEVSTNAEVLAYHPGR